MGRKVPPGGMVTLSIMSVKGFSSQRRDLPHGKALRQTRKKPPVCVGAVSIEGA